MVKDKESTGRKETGHAVTAAPGAPRRRGPRRSHSFSHPAVPETPIAGHTSAATSGDSLTATVVGVLTQLIGLIPREQLVGVLTAAVGPAAALPDVPVPPHPPRLWANAARDEGPIEFANLVYAVYRARGMRLADLRTLDPSLYQAFTNRCYYLGKKPRMVFETSPPPSGAPDRPADFGKTQDAHATPRKPRRSEIGRTISVAEFGDQLRAYNRARQQMRRARLAK
jgi:hypothetical protein